MKKITLLFLLISQISAFSQIISPNGDNIFYYNGAADVTFRYLPRGAGGRAFVHADGNVLSLNFGSDFKGGTRIGNDVYFKDGGNSYIYSGNFGIGTSTPSNDQGWNRVLDVSGTNHSKILATSGNSLYKNGIFSHSSWHGGGGFIGTESNHSLFLMAGYDPKMTILTNGNVGVGTTNPRANLDMAKDISNGQLGTVFGRLPEGNETGLGTYLGVKGYATQGNDLYNLKSFSIVHDFYGQTNSSINFLRGGSVLGGCITFSTFDNTEKMRIAGNGNVGIGTVNPTSKLTVAGNINSREVKVSVDAGADFVFEKDYALPSLQEVEKFVTKNKHLPEIASAKEMQKEGINLSEMNIKLLQKIEELTLYVIEQNKQLKLQSEKIEKQDQEFKIFKTKIKKLESKKQ